MRAPRGRPKASRTGPHPRAASADPPADRSSPHRTERPTPDLPRPEGGLAGQRLVKQRKVHATYRDSALRLAKYLAHAGVASRRAAETIIAAGRVRVDGAVITDPARDVDDTHSVLVDG